MLDTLKKRYDFILLDSAPLSLSPDGCAMGRHADLVLFAVKWRKTGEHQVKTGISKLFQFGAKRIDTALTFIEREDERRYRRRVHNLDEA
jgi:Mrp family chromosome partitioning ATPase